MSRDYYCKKGKNMEESEELEAVLDALREILYKEAKREALSSIECRMTVMASLLLKLEEKSPQQFHAACRLMEGKSISQIAREMKSCRRTVEKLLERAEKVIPQIARLRGQKGNPSGD